MNTHPQSRHTPSRRTFLRAAAASTLGLMAANRVEAAPVYDLVIKGAMLVDGTGGPARVSDIGITGDTIVALGTVDPAHGREVLNAAGLHVCPGFVDIHSHSDRYIFATPGADSRARQGITTEVTGNCGSSAAPQLEGNWKSVASYAALIGEAGVAVNQALLLGQGTLRFNAVQMVDRPLTQEELARVLDAVETGMNEGAFGLSTGLEYTPGRYTPTDEIVAMAKVVARHGGLYASHIRNEEAGLIDAVRECLDIGGQARVRTQVSHIKAAGRPNWGKQDEVLRMIEAARAEGIDVMGDAYPYTAYSTSLGIFLPDCALEGGEAEARKRLQDPAQRSRIREYVGPRVASDPGGFELIVLATSPGDDLAWTVGVDVAAIAARWAVEPVDALLRLIEESGGASLFVGHAMDPANVDRVLAHPLVMIGSDGAAMAPPEPGNTAPTQPHPRSYGTCPRVLGHYVRERKLFDLPTAIRKMTSMPAERLGLTDRGRIAEEMKADLVMFDPATVAETSTFDAPHQYPIGIPHVIVNGTFVVRDGTSTGARPGKMLRRG